MKLSTEYPAEPEFAAQHAELAVKMARSVSHVRLDYSAGSVKRLDRIIERFRQERVSGTEIPETLFTLGCYLGEVLIRHCGGEWRKAQRPSGGKGSRVPMVVHLATGEVADPIGQVFRRLRNGKQDSLPAFYGSLAAGCQGKPAPGRAWWQFWIK